MCLGFVIRNSRKQILLASVILVCTAAVSLRNSILLYEIISCFRDLNSLIAKSLRNEVIALQRKDIYFPLYRN